MTTRSIASPITYAAILLLVYGSIFLGSPLSWFNSIYINDRYLNIFVVYCVFLLTAYSLSALFITSKEGTVKSGNAPKLERRADAIFWIVLVFCILRLAALKEVPLFGNLGARYNVDLSLGGFIDYTCTLANPLAIFYFCAWIKDKDKRKILKYIALVALQILFFKRLDLFVLIFGSALSASYYKKLSTRTILTAIIFGAPAIYALLGLGAIVRAGGTENVSRLVPFWELPFWVVVSDLNGATKFGHYIADAFGPGGMGLNYTLGIFSAALGSDSLHSAGLLMSYVDGATTAQSINAPISYYVDGGYQYVAFLAIIQGIVWRLFRTGFGNKYFSAIANTIIFIQSLWTIRSGELLFPPSRIYELLMLFALFYTPSKDQVMLGVQQIARFGFYGALSMTCLFMAIRLPSAF